MSRPEIQTANSEVIHRTYLRRTVTQLKYLRHVNTDRPVRLPLCLLMVAGREPKSGPVPILLDWRNCSNTSSATSSSRRQAP